MTGLPKIPIILLNGPPGAGKDTAATIIQDWLSNHDIHSYITRFSAPIKRAFAGFINAAELDDLGESIPHARDKESPIPILNNHSYRNWQILFSEAFVKPNFGTHTFADLLANEIIAYQFRSHGMDPYFWIISDCGFQSEVDRFAENFDPAFIALFRIRRPGHTFARDSRQYVEPKGGFLFSEIANAGSIEEFKWNLDRMMRVYLEQPRSHNPDAVPLSKPLPQPASVSASPSSQTGPSSHSGGSTLHSQIPPESES